MDSNEFHDVVIVGAGPAGLSFAASLRGTRCRIALVDKLDTAGLGDPAYDGREIALTLESVATLRELGIWERLPAEQVAPLRGARVFNGESRHTLHLRAPGAKGADIGYLVSNHLLRRAAFHVAVANANVSFFPRSSVVRLMSEGAYVHAVLSDGRSLRARLVVAADSRFSETRRTLGIPAWMDDFGKSMLVCRMAHQVAHDHIAWEWFGDHQTLALLPLNGRCSSVVITLPHTQVARLQGLPIDAFEREVETRFGQRLGEMKLRSERFVYPLVGVYARRFVAERYATIGDAAVGMHPVTAHGFNLGLAGQKKLARLVRRAHQVGRDIGSPTLLRRYEQAHRRATLPLYLATNAVVRLYTDDSPPAQVARGALLHLAHRASPIGAALSRWLMQERIHDRR